MSALDVLQSRSDLTGECWIWNGPQAGQGYGVISIDGRLVYVHRLAHELLIGPIPQGYEVDHLCFTRRCWRPDHLEAVTHAENCRRAGDRVTHCRHGHAFTPENTWREKNGRRHCRTCNREAKRRAWAIKRGRAA